MAQNVICLVIDRLHPGYLGTYGNTWIHTPNIDRLAAESAVFDRAIVDTPNFDLAHRSLWLGLHAMCPDDRAAVRRPLPAIFSAAGWQTTLLTDGMEIANHTLAQEFQQQVIIPSAARSNSGGPATVTNLDETDAAPFFAAAGECIESAQPPFFLWLHTGTLDRLWDAPLEFRQQYADEDDPTAGNWARVPNRTLEEAFDPDERVAIAHAYAGQVSGIDQMLGPLLDIIDRKGLNNSTLITLYSPRGMALGEHRRMGKCDEALYAELVHVPWIMRLPGSEAAGQRYHELVQPAELPASILKISGIDAWQLEEDRQFGFGRSILPLIQGLQASNFDRACTIGPENQKRIDTPAWTLRLSNSNASTADLPEPVLTDVKILVADQKAELFAKPDDWFEVNEVEDRCPEIVDKLRIEFDAFQKACTLGEPAMLADLPRELRVRLD